MTAQQQWVVTAVWSDSAPTVYGPFPTSDQAEVWAAGSVARLVACVEYRVETLISPTRKPVQP
ncbi:MAG: hypothetical protein ACTHMS_23455 [Jatrophihabitans sp.]|uniref:hypothetical protein n=1 Tax=Jatrophihabitans sp. TaxID=1932789 RepID=UPI003F7F8EA6